MGARGGLLTRMATGLAAASLAGLWLAAGPVDPALASCAADANQFLMESRHVVTGTVVDTSTGFARLKVAEIWRGGPVGPLLWVQTAIDQPSFPANLFRGVGSSGDIELTRGDRLVVGTDQEFRTDVCRVFQVDDAVVAQQRPAEVERPVPNGSRGADRPVGPVKVIGWSLTGLALAALLYVGLRPRPAGPSAPAGAADGGSGVAPGEAPSAGGPDPAPGG